MLFSFEIGALLLSSYFVSVVFPASSSSLDSTGLALHCDFRASPDYYFEKLALHVYVRGLQSIQPHSKGRHFKLRDALEDERFSVASRIFGTSALAARGSTFQFQKLHGASPESQDTSGSISLVLVLLLLLAAPPPLGSRKIAKSQNHIVCWDFDF